MGLMAFEIVLSATSCTSHFGSSSAANDPFARDHFHSRVYDRAMTRCETSLYTIDTVVNTFKNVNTHSNFPVRIVRKPEAGSISTRNVATIAPCWSFHMCAQAFGIV